MIDSKKNFILILSATLVFLVIVALWIYLKNPAITKELTYKKEVQDLKTQSTSNTVESIEKDLSETDLSDIDKELTDIDMELNSTQ